jgi:hypothetical protein
MTGFASKRQSAWNKFAKPWNGIAGWEEIGKNMKTDEDDEFARIEMEQRMRETLAQPAQEPFGYFRVEPFGPFGWTDCAETDEGAVALYEAPQQRPWVGLTDDEVYKIAFTLEGEHWRKITDAIEAKLKDKNI